MLDFSRIEEDIRVNEDAREPETDMLHPFGKHADWNESFYFNFYDKVNDYCGFMRIGLKPNKDEKNMLCFFLSPEGHVIGARDVVPFSDSQLRVKGLKFERIVPDREWRLEYRGSMRHTVGSEIQRRDVSFDLTFKAINKVFDYRESASGYYDLVSRVSPAEHNEQFGRIDGTATIGTETISISGLGERDHAWGTTDWIAPATWIWLSGQFSERLAFNFTKLSIGKEIVDAGFIHVDGVNRPIVKVDIATEFSKGGGPKSLRAWLMEADGKMHEIEALIIRTARLPFAGSIDQSVSVMYETLAKYRMGDETGYGIAEYLIRGT
jgi:hypothetical protein